MWSQAIYIYSLVWKRASSTTYRMTVTTNEGRKGIHTVRRRQFPITAAYAFTDYRSQGQTITYVLVDIAPPPRSKGYTQPLQPLCCAIKEFRKGYNSLARWFWRYYWSKNFFFVIHPVSTNISSTTLIIAAFQSGGYAVTRRNSVIKTSNIESSSRFQVPITSSTNLGSMSYLIIHPGPSCMNHLIDYYSQQARWQVNIPITLCRAYRRRRFGYAPISFKLARGSDRRRTPAGKFCQFVYVYIYKKKKILTINRSSCRPCIEYYWFFEAWNSTKEIMVIDGQTRSRFVNMHVTRN